MRGHHCETSTKKRAGAFFFCFPQRKRRKSRLVLDREANEAKETASKATEDGVEETTNKDEETADNLVESLEQTRESDEERGEEGDEAA